MSCSKHSLIKFQLKPEIDRQESGSTGRIATDRIATDQIATVQKCFSAGRNKKNGYWLKTKNIWSEE